MRVLLVLALLAVSTATTAAAGSCVRTKTRACLKPPATVNLHYAPDISTKIVAGDPLAQDAKKSAFKPADPEPYTGPAFGMTPNHRGATVGYRWSTD